MGVSYESFAFIKPFESDGIFLPGSSLLCLDFSLLAVILSLEPDLSLILVSSADIFLSPRLMDFPNPEPVV